MDVSAIRNIRDRSTISLNDAKRRLDVLNDVRALSSGTLATLTGHRDYTTLDLIHNDFITFVNITIPRTRYRTWMDAWARFWKDDTK